MKGKHARLGHGGSRMKSMKTMQGLINQDEHFMAPKEPII